MHRVCTVQGRENEKKNTNFVKNVATSILIFLSKHPEIHKILLFFLCILLKKTEFFSFACIAIKKICTRSMSLPGCFFRFFYFSLAQHILLATKNLCNLTLTCLLATFLLICTFFLFPLRWMTSVCVFENWTLPVGSRWIAGTLQHSSQDRYTTVCA